MKTITVFCGSSFGNSEIFEQKAYELGKMLAQQQIRVVYGGANVGLMGTVANGALENGGEVTGVLPVFLKEKEIAHTGLTELILVDTMHQRKTKMEMLCDGIIALPGGFGTLEEFFEVITWGQLGLHRKPMALLNIGGFYDPLISMMDSMVEMGFLKQANRQMVIIAEDISDLLELMKNYQPPATGKWIDKQKT